MGSVAAPSHAHSFAHVALPSSSSASSSAGKKAAGVGSAPSFVEWPTLPASLPAPGALMDADQQQSAAALISDSAKPASYDLHSHSTSERIESGGALPAGAPLQSGGDPFEVALRAHQASLLQQQLSQQQQLDGSSSNSGHSSSVWDWFMHTLQSWHFWALIIAALLCCVGGAGSMLATDAGSSQRHRVERDAGSYDCSSEDDAMDDDREPMHGRRHAVGLRGTRGVADGRGHSCLYGRASSASR